MIVSFFHVSVPSEQAGKFEMGWSHRAGQVDQMPGFRGMDVLRDTGEPGHYIVMTRWDSRADFDAWLNSPAFAGGHAHAGDAGGTSETLEDVLEFFEIVPNATDGGAAHP